MPEVEIEELVKFANDPNNWVLLNDGFDLMEEPPPPFFEEEEEERLH
jgi:hypothetical protein